MLARFTRTGTDHTSAAGYALAKSASGALCSSAFVGSTMYRTSPPSSASSCLSSPVGYTGALTQSPPSRRRTTFMRTVADTFANTSSCSNAHSPSPSS